MKGQRFSVAGYESDSAMRKTADAASSPIIFSSERWGISHVSPWRVVCVWRTAVQYQDIPAPEH